MFSPNNLFTSSEFAGYPRLVRLLPIFSCIVLQTKWQIMLLNLENKTTEEILDALRAEIKARKLKKTEESKEVLKEIMKNTRR